MKHRILLFLTLLVLTLFPADAGDAGRTESRPEQCWAMTRSGNRCKRRAAPGERYCRQHAASIPPSKPVLRCRSMTPEGVQCTEKPLEGKRYCAKHAKPHRP